MATYFKELIDPDFYNFFKTLKTQVNTNHVAWNILPAKNTELTDAFNVYDPLYTAIINEFFRTHQQVLDHRAGRDTAMQFIEDFANEFIIPNSAISDTTVGALGFNRKSDERQERPDITAVVFGMLNALPGSRIEITCRTASDASRASIAENADAVEVRYSVGTNPATWEECPNKEISTKAKFTITLNPSDAGKTIYVFLRWRNNRDVIKSGPFGDKLSTIVRS